MSLFCWKKCQERREQRLAQKYNYKTAKQMEKTTRAIVRNERIAFAAMYGVDQSVGSQIASGLQPVAEFGTEYLRTQRMAGMFGSFVDPETREPQPVLWVIIGLVVLMLMK